MENNIPIHLQEVIFASSDTAISRQLGKLEESGQIKKIAPRIYTSNFNETAEIIIRRNIFTILGKLYPGAKKPSSSTFPASIWFYVIGVCFVGCTAQNKRYNHYRNQ